jgi:hypothetical protein
MKTYKRITEIETYPVTDSGRIELLHQYFPNATLSSDTSYHKLGVYIKHSYNSVHVIHSAMNTVRLILSHGIIN